MVEVNSAFGRQTLHCNNHVSFDASKRHRQFRAPFVSVAKLRCRRPVMVRYQEFKGTTACSVLFHLRAVSLWVMVWRSPSNFLQNLHSN